MVGNVRQPKLGRFCVGVNLLPSFSFSLLLKENDWRKVLEFQAKFVFLLFSQFCKLKNLVSLLDFMLQRVLIWVSVETVWCQRYSSRNDVWHLSVFYLATKSVTDIVFHFSSLLQVGLKFDTSRDIQSDFGENVYNVGILKWKTYNASEFES